MSRSGYIEDCENEWATICWRGAVASSIRGKRGQAFLREMLAALDVIPSKQLIAHDLENLHGVCALGAVGRARDIPMPDIHPDDWCTERDDVAALFGVAPALVAEIMYENDEAVPYWADESPEHRWERVRHWVEKQIR